MTEEHKKRTEPLLLEVGVEEIPARFLRAAERDLGDRLVETLRALRLMPADAPAVRTYSTPRRLVAHAPQVFVRQSDQTEEIIGPPVKVAYDVEGKPTRAAESFAQKNGVPVNRLVRIETPKGPYVGVRKSVRGRPAREVLARALPDVIVGISFPKSMYWTSKTGPRFIRPIRWLVAILGENERARPIPFEIAGVSSRKATYGHRVVSSRPIPVSGFEDYAEKLHKHQVEIDPGKRAEIIREEIKAILEGRGLNAIRDEELHDWIVNSTEWPRALLGGFDRRFLHLPREILVTVMRDHQKYFAVEDANGDLQPNFIAIMNVDQDSAGLIREGHERVLTARFVDAEFFWNTDQRIPLRDRQEMLAKVTYQAEIGSYAEKVERMTVLADEICSGLEQQGEITSAEREHVLRAVRLCKCDLTTQMVREFTELQGIVGGLYARAQGEPDIVADAIYDHYKPANVGDDCPRSKVGAIVSLADKLDSVVAGFAAGLEPTGSSDPFGLRRAGNGIVKIAVESLGTLDLLQIADRAAQLALRGAPGAKDESLIRRVENFLRERMDFYFREVANLRYDTVRAVLSPAVPNGANLPAIALERARALEGVRDTEDFLALAAAAKRTRNILTKSAGMGYMAGTAAVDTTLLAEGPERDLYAAYETLVRNLELLEKRGDYSGSFLNMAAIRPQVDLFFDKVLVMAEDPAVRENRLRLLVRLNRDVFTRLADLSEVAVESRAAANVAQAAR
jgi:glycyl-tRNA synthetase beta chain